jgi:hypothetical protein
MFREDRKATLQTLVGIFIVLLGFMLLIAVVYQFFSRAEEATAEVICRGSVAARQKTFKETMWGAGPNLQLSPLLCKTIDKDAPEDKYDKTKEGIKQNFGDLIARCWWQFGEGLVQGMNVFGEKGWVAPKDKCFVCYTVHVSKSKGFGTGNYISKADLERWLSITPYRVGIKEDSLTDEGTEELKEPQCERNGGKCKQFCTGDEIIHNEWKCPAYNACCVGKELFVTYLDYIQSYGGIGRIMIEDNLKIKPLETYAITIAFDTPRNWFWDWQWDSGQINRIIVSKLKTVQDHCVIQRDIQGR